MLLKNIFISPAYRLPLGRSLSLRSTISSTFTRFQSTTTDEEPAIESNDFAPTLSVEESRLHPEVKSAFISEIGATFTPAQQQSMGQFISSKDGIVVRSKTGTGKTFAFGLPIFHSIKSSTNPDIRKSVSSVIICPTRDLATQNHISLEKVWSRCNKKTRARESEISLVMGQTSISNCSRRFSNSDKPSVVICTPGRFLDMMKNDRNFRASFPYLTSVIIDEADELLNQNFKQDIEDIINELKSLNKNEAPPKTMMFSATMSPEVFSLAQNIIGKDFPFIDTNAANSSEVNENITQTLVKTSTIFESYVSAIKFIIDRIGTKGFKPIIFLSNTVSVDFFYALLKQMMYVSRKRARTNIIHGKIPQGARSRSQENFRNDPASILVASNVISRGMDFPDVSHVIQIGVNHEISNYTHRVGRTGRAGKKGEALLFTTATEAPFVNSLASAGNNFHEVEEYEADAEFEASVKEQTSSMSGIDQIIHSNISAYNSVPTSVGGLDKLAIIKDCSQLYQDLTGSTELPFLSANVATRMGMNTEEAREFFNIPGPAKKSKPSRGGFGFKSNRNSERSGFNDRDFSRSNDRRDGNRKGGYSNDRRDGNRKGGYSNDRYGSSGGNRGGNRSSDSSSRRDRF